MKKGRWTRMFMAAMAAAFLLAGLSTVPAKEVEEVLITAMRYETGELETPAFVTVITADELEKTGGRNLVEALRTISGLGYVSYGPMGTSHGGMSSELPIRGVRGGELVLINGVPINSPFGGGYDLNCIPLSAIERVEVVKGASSTLYGSSALTGVINIITKKQETEEINSHVSMEGGTESYTRNSLSVGNNKLFASISYLHFGMQEGISNNYSKKSSYNSGPLDEYSLLLNAAPLENLTFNYLGNREKVNWIRVPWEDAIETGSNSYQENDQTLEKHFANMVFKRSGFTVNNYFYQDAYKYGDDSPETKIYRYGANPQYHREFGEIFDFLAGGDYEFDHADSAKYGVNHKKDNYSLYSTLVYKPVENVSFSLGGRNQWIVQVDADNYSEFCPQFQANYLLTPDFSFYANAGRAFRAPDFVKLYVESSFLVGNPSLKPESGWSYEAGTKYMNSFAAVKLAAFLMKYEDKIEIDYSRGYPLTYYNADRFETKGVEWDIETYPADYWTIGLAGYWADPIVEDTTGEKQQAGAKFQLSPSIGFDNDSFRVKATVLMIRNRQMELDNFSSTNIVMGYKLWKGETILSISNLFDKKNVTCGNMTSTSTSRYEYYDTERIISLGYKLNF